MYNIEQDFLNVSVWFMDHTVWLSFDLNSESNLIQTAWLAGFDSEHFYSIYMSVTQC